METYPQMRQRHEEQINAFPIAFAFSNEQFEKACQKLNISVESAPDHLTDIGGGGFIRKTDKADFIKLFDTITAEKLEAMKRYDFALSAFVWELHNHEYIVTYSTEDTLDALEVTEAFLQENPDTKRALKDACRQVIQSYVTQNDEE